MEESAANLIQTLTSNFKLILLSGRALSEVEYRQNIQDVAHYLNITIQNEDLSKEYLIKGVAEKTKTQFNSLEEEDDINARNLYFIKGV